MATEVAPAMMLPPPPCRQLQLFQPGNVTFQALQTNYLSTPATSFSSVTPMPDNRHPQSFLRLLKKQMRQKRVTTHTQAQHRAHPPLRKCSQIDDEAGSHSADALTIQETKSDLLDWAFAAHLAAKDYWWIAAPAQGQSGGVALLLHPSCYIFQNRQTGSRSTRNDTTTGTSSHQTPSRRSNAKGAPNGSLHQDRLLQGIRAARSAVPLGDNETGYSPSNLYSVHSPPSLAAASLAHIFAPSAATMAVPDLPFIKLLRFLLRAAHLPTVLLSTLRMQLGWFQVTTIQQWQAFLTMHVTSLFPLYRVVSLIDWAKLCRPLNDPSFLQWPMTSSPTNFPTPPIWDPVIDSLGEDERRILVSRKRCRKGNIVEGAYPVNAQKTLSEQRGATYREEEAAATRSAAVRDKKRGGAMGLKYQLMVEKVCKRCKAGYHPSANDSGSCRYHPSMFVCRRHDDQTRYYELGPNDPPYAAKFYDCCGAEEPDAAGCKTASHVSYDDEE
ncbi:hypothetical protein R1flu_015234 [Riccia fluitans]|uniref:Uncharacterized protein n=1 Tax=Riccia fluitans TaxID=41844 RepID=A0ABD1YIQ8_9MARC